MTIAGPGDRPEVLVRRECERGDLVPYQEEHAEVGRDEEAEQRRHTVGEAAECGGAAGAVADGGLGKRQIPDSQIQHHERPHQRPPGPVPAVVGLGEGRSHDDGSELVVRERGAEVPEEPATLAPEFTYQGRSLPQQRPDLVGDGPRHGPRERAGAPGEHRTGGGHRPEHDDQDEHAGLDHGEHHVVDQGQGRFAPPKRRGAPVVLHHQRRDGQGHRKERVAPGRGPGRQDHQAEDRDHERPGKPDQHLGAEAGRRAAVALGPAGHHHERLGHQRPVHPDHGEPAGDEEQVAAEGGGTGHLRDGDGHGEVGRRGHDLVGHRRHHLRSEAAARRAARRGRGPDG
jgi:hypothetical protein